MADAWRTLKRMLKRILRGRLRGTYIIHYIHVNLQLFIYFGHWMNVLGKHEETIFQPLNCIGQEHPLFITEYRPKTTRDRGIPCLGWMILITTPTPFTILKETSVLKVL